MRKNLEKVNSIPNPVLMVATYDEDGKADVMNVAWGGQCGPQHIAINIGQHKTTDNIKAKQEFTVSFATKDTLEVSDYFGIASGADVDKIEQSKVTVTKAEKVDAPIIEEYPLTFECKVIEIEEKLGENRIVGEVVNVSADESVLDENGNLALEKLQPIIFDGYNAAYNIVGEKVGNAFADGKKLME